jgi:WXG100 family type VII secretion target
MTPQNWCTGGISGDGNVPSKQRVLLGQGVGLIWMGEDLRVDPLEVRIAADHVDVAADGLKTDHGSAQERIGTAQAGWIGTSGTALSQLATKWEQDSATHYTELVGHVEGFQSAAAQYVGTDKQGSDEIDSAASNLGTMGL